MSKRGHAIPIFILAIAAACLAVLPWIRELSYRSNDDIHGTLEMVGAILGLLAGISCLARGAARDPTFHACIGLGLIANGCVDFVHGLISLPSVSSFLNLQPDTLERFIPGTFVTGRLMLGISVLTGLFISARTQQSKPQNFNLWAWGLATAGVTILLTYLSMRIPFPQMLFSDFIISRPLDAISAIVLLCAGIGLINIWAQQNNPFILWMIITLGLATWGQCVMARSQYLHDAAFDLAHVIKLATYAVPILGISIIQARTLRKLQRAEEQAQLAHTAKSAFLGRMSHEFRTPMNGLLGLLRVVAESGLSPVQHRHLHTAQGCAHSLVRLLTDVIDMAHIENKTLTMQQEPCDPERIAHEVIALFQDHALSQGVLLSLQCDTHLINAHVMLDGARVRQMMISLVDNALKFTEHGSVTVLVTTTPPTGTHRRLVITIRDTGIGMPDAILQRLKEPFAQAMEDTARRYGGLGLGLSLTTHLAQLMGGMLHISSKKDVGTTATLSIPVQTVSALVAGMVSEPEVAQDRRYHGRILLAEDNSVNQLLVELLLKKRVDELRIVANGACAIDTVQNEGPWDLILMDWHMPEMDGLTATQRIRSWEAINGSKPLPTIGLTGSVMPGDAEQCLAAGMDAVLGKPLEPRALHAELERHLRVVDNSRQHLSIQQANHDRTLLAGLDHLRGSLAPEEFHKLMQRTISSLQLTLTRTHAVMNPDCVIAFQEAHAVKTSAKGLGLTVLANQAETIEFQARHDQSINANDWHQFRENLHLTLEAIRRECRENPDSASPPTSASATATATRPSSHS